MKGAAAGAFRAITIEIERVTYESCENAAP
jgi:hypothetical protein